MNRRKFIKQAGLVSSAVALAPAFARSATLADSDSQAKSADQAGKSDKKNSKPNVLLIVCDDLGYADINCYGGRFGYTPNLDKFAKTGVRFTNGYASCAVCTPSRISILTGRYPQAFGFSHHFRDVRSDFLPATHCTVASVLKKAGYYTAHVGKWHLGGLTLDAIADRKANRKAPPGPLEHGFDDYTTGIEDKIVRRPLFRQSRLYKDGAKHIVRNDIVPQPLEKGNWTAVKTDQAIRYIEKSQTQGKPFFVNLWYDAPHQPWEFAPKKFVFKDDKTVDPVLKRRRHVMNPNLPAGAKWGGQIHQLMYLSTVTHMDYQVGRLIAKLKKLGLYDNTLIIFTSDNGGMFTADNGDLTGGKASVYEGGVRVPFVAAWPGKIKPGAVSDLPVSGVDLLPAIASAANAKLPKKDIIDGVDFLQSFVAGKKMPERILFWKIDQRYSAKRHGKQPSPKGNCAARLGKYKLIANGDNPVALYDLSQDRSERKNLLSDPKKAKIADKLTRALRDWQQNPKQPIPKF